MTADFRQLMSASCRNRTFRIAIASVFKVRFAPESGHYANIDLNYCFVPKPDIVTHRIFFHHAVRRQIL